MSARESLKNEILNNWNCSMVEFNGEEDHVHLLISIKPDKRISDLVSNLKSASCKNLWRDYPELSKTYWKKKVAGFGTFIYE